jgi:hypothetical protein
MVARRSTALAPVTAAKMTLRPRCTRTRASTTPAAASARGLAMARLSLYVSIALYCGPAAVMGTGGPSSAVAWTHAHPKVELSEGGTVATAVGTGMDGWCTAVCDGAACVMAGSERFYVEIEWLAGEKLMAGVAGASFDPTKGKPGQMSTRSSEAGWAYSAWSDGRLYHDGRAIDWAGFETGAAVGDTIGLLADLSRGTLSLRINGEWQGDMIEEGLKGPLRWTVDLFKESDKAVGSSARIQSKPAPSDPGIEKLLRDAARKGDLGVLGGLLDAGARNSRAPYMPALRTRD